MIHTVHDVWRILQGVLQLGEDATSVQNFSEALVHHQEAYDLVLAGTENEEKRQTAELKVYRQGLTEHINRWRPQFPDTGHIRSGDWAMPAKLSQLLPVLRKSKKNLEDWTVSERPRVSRHHSL
jgi:hypothetical protein